MTHTNPNPKPKWNSPNHDLITRLRDSSGGCCLTVLASSSGHDEPSVLTLSLRHLALIVLISGHLGSSQHPLGSLTCHLSRERSPPSLWISYSMRWEAWVDRIQLQSDWYLMRSYLHQSPKFDRKIKTIKEHPFTWLYDKSPSLIALSSFFMGRKFSFSFPFFQFRPNGAEKET